MQDFINEILKISTDNFYYLHFIIPFTLTMTILPFGVRILSYFNIYDVPNSRKVHTIPIPSTGGVIIYFCFILTSLIFLPFKDIMPAYIAGSGFLVFIGFMDDFKSISPYYKFLSQILAALIFVSLTNKTLNISFFDNLPFVQFILVILFIVGVTNAFNLIDGMDGLAAGLSIITFIVLTTMMDYYKGLLILILICCIFGFLRANTFPALIFMGDSGSYFIGYSIAIFTIVLFEQISYPLYYIPLIIGIPLFDTTYVFLKRIINRVNPFVADNNHFHHLLTNLGIHHKNVVFLLYSIQTILALIVLIISGNIKSEIGTILLILFFLTSQHLFLILRDDLNKIKRIKFDFYGKLFKRFPWLSISYIPYFLSLISILFFMLGYSVDSLNQGQVIMILISLICATVFLIDNNAGRSSNVSIGLILLGWNSFYFHNPKLLITYPIKFEYILALLGVGVVLSLFGMYKKNYFFDSPTEYLSIIILLFLMILPLPLIINQNAFYLIFLFLVYKISLQNKAVRKWNLLYLINIASLFGVILKNIEKTSS